VLGDLLLDQPGGTGLVIHAFATVNAGAGDAGQPFPGRLYGLLLARSEAELDTVDTEVADRLAAVAKGA
jgi:hypothetical protein